MNRLIPAKTAALAAAIAGLLVLAASCSLLAPADGGLSFTIPEEMLTASGGRNASGRALVADDATLGYVRVYMEAQGGLINVGTKGLVFETAIRPDRTITIENMPPIRNVTLYLALSVAGYDPATALNNFRAARYAKSAPFNVVAGATTPVPILVADSPFEDIGFDPDGGYLRDAVSGVRGIVVGGVRYFLADGFLYWNDGAVINELDILGAHGGVSIGAAYSLAEGKDLLPTGEFGARQLWINTDKGIWTLVSGALVQVETSDVAKSAAVLDSGAIRLEYESTGDVDGVPTTEIKYFNVIYYQRKGSIGGAFKDGAAWKWFDLYDYLDQVGPLKAAIENNKNRLINDLVLNETEAGTVTYGYVSVGGLNSLRVSGDIQASVEPFIPEGDAAFDISGAMSAVLDGNTIAVPNQAIITGLAKAGTRLYVGTDRGVFILPVSATNGAITGSAGVNILPRVADVVRLRAAFVDDDDNIATAPVEYLAVLGKRGSVYIVKNGVFLKEFPFYTGIPAFNGQSAATGDLFWTDDGLIITGADGAVLLSNTRLGQI